MQARITYRHGARPFWVWVRANHHRAWEHKKGASFISFDRAVAHCRARTYDIVKVPLGFPTASAPASVQEEPQGLFLVVRGEAYVISVAPSLAVANAKAKETSNDPFHTRFGEDVFIYRAVKVIERRVTLNERDL